MSVIEQAYLKATADKYVHLGYDAQCVPKANPGTPFLLKVIVSSNVEVQDDGVPEGRYFQISNQTDVETLNRGDVVIIISSGTKYKLERIIGRNDYESKFLAAKTK